MTFMASLAANPSGSGIFGQPAPNNQDPLALVNNIKDREMRDFQNKANFMSELSLKQDRQRALFNPEDPNNQLGASATNRQPQQNTVIGQTQRDPNLMDANQKAELGIKQQGLGLEREKMAQAGKMGEERIANQTKQEALNQQKSDQIHQQKQAELEAKINEAGGKLTQAQAALEAKTKAGEDTLQAHKDLAAAVEERHKLEIDNLNHKFEVTSEQHDKQIKNMEERLKQQGNKTTTTSVNPEGTQRTVNTKSGSAAQNVVETNKDGTLHVMGPKTKDVPDGRYDIPANQLDHWNSLYGDQQTTGQPNATP